MSKVLQKLPREFNLGLNVILWVSLTRTGTLRTFQWFLPVLLHSPTSRYQIISTTLAVSSLTLFHLMQGLLCCCIRPLRLIISVFKYWSPNRPTLLLGILFFTVKIEFQSPCLRSFWVSLCTGPLLFEFVPCVLGWFIQGKLQVKLYMGSKRAWQMASLQKDALLNRRRLSKGRKSLM